MKYLAIVSDTNERIEANSLWIAAIDIEGEDIE